MIRQTTLGHAVRLSGRGLHTGHLGIVTLRPASADYGRRITPEGRDVAPVPIEWPHWVPSPMSTSVATSDGTSIRTIEHMMAALSAHGVDNVDIEVSGPEIPIFDGSAARWGRALQQASIVPLEAPRRAIRLRKAVQVARDGGFLRAEPAPRFEVDATHDVLPGFPIMRWRGVVDAPCFDRELSRSRSFGHLGRRLGLAPRPRTRTLDEQAEKLNTLDSAVGIDETPWRDIDARRAMVDRGMPLLKGWRPWRATLIVGARVLPWPRFADEPVRHVTLDMIGDLALVGASLIARIVAHNPSHEKTFALVSALMRRPDCWDRVTLDPISAGTAS